MVMGCVTMTAMGVCVQRAGRWSKAAPNICTYFCQASRLGCESLRAGSGVAWVLLPSGGAERGTWV